MMKKSNVDSIEKLATLMAEGFEHVDEQFEGVGEKVADLDKKLGQEMRDIKERLRRLEHDPGEIKDELRAVTRAVDKDAVTLIRHESRIKHLEHVG